MDPSKHPGIPTQTSAPLQSRTRVRFEILALIAVGTMINALDRTPNSITLPLAAV